MSSGFYIRFIRVEALFKVHVESIRGAREKVPINRRNTKGHGGQGKAAALGSGTNFRFQTRVVLSIATRTTLVG